MAVPEKDGTIELLTNHLEFGATTIASIYQDRWEIELFFKALKQNLKVKTFVGTSENALRRIQVWTALIALLLLRINLFTYRSLLDWIQQPLGSPPLEETDSGGVQLEFPFPDFGQQ